MLTSKAHAYKRSFFDSKRILSTRQALLFVIEEAVMLLLIVFQLYRFVGIEVVNQQVRFFTAPIYSQNILMFAGTIFIFLIGYVVIALRDESVWLVHKNFSRMVFGTAKLKVEFATKKKVMLLFFELAYTLVVAISIFVYLDPDINIVPAPYNYIGFVALFIVGLVLFSHTKEFRSLVYGPTPVQKRFQIGRHDLRRFTNKKTGSIRIAPRNHYKKHKK